MNNFAILLSGQEGLELLKNFIVNLKFPRKDDF
jgi:hypothetical protein